MTDETLTRFKSELDSFFVLVLLNMVFGALAMAFGMQFIIASVLGLAGGQSTPALRILAGSISLVGFGLGLSWVLSSAKILKGINAIRREFRSCPAPVTGEVLTGWILQMTAHYRQNKKAIGLMTRICTLGGCVFLALGIINLIGAVAVWGSPAGILVASLFFITTAINLTIGIASLRFSSYFRRYSRAWDNRIDEVSQNEKALHNFMERG